MNAFYDDILALSVSPPEWFDEHAVPRFCAFEPAQAADIYADEVVLALIRCQNCHHEFKVAFSLNSMAYFMQQDDCKRRLSEMITQQTLHYGDPPNVGCCHSGPTMNSEMMQVLEYWQRNERFEWQRNTALEITFDNEEEEG